MQKLTDFPANWLIWYKNLGLTFGFVASYDVTSPSAPHRHLQLTPNRPQCSFNVPSISAPLLPWNILQSTSKSIVRELPSVSRPYLRTVRLEYYFIVLGAFKTSHSIHSRFIQPRQNEINELHLFNDSLISDQSLQGFIEDISCRTTTKLDMDILVVAICGAERELSIVDP